MDDRGPHSGVSKEGPDSAEHSSPNRPTRNACLAHLRVTPDGWNGAVGLIDGPYLLERSPIHGLKN